MCMNRHATLPLPPSDNTFSLFEYFTFMNIIMLASTATGDFLGHDSHTGGQREGAEENQAKFPGRLIYGCITSGRWSRILL
jgi:hypothetical protein